MLSTAPSPPRPARLTGRSRAERPAKDKVQARDPPRDLILDPPRKFMWSLSADGSENLILAPVAGVVSRRLRFCGSSRGSCQGQGLVAGSPGSRLAVWCVDRVWAGQAAAAGGPQAASNRFIHSCSRCQPPGQVHGEMAAAVAGDAGGGTDKAGAQGGAAGFGAGEAGQGADGGAAGCS